MASDIPITPNMSRLYLELLEAIDVNGGVECAEAPEIFFPEDFKSPANAGINMTRLAEKTAKEICLRCPVMSLCLKVGLHEPFGIWGGTTPDQRKQIRRGYEI